MLHLVGTSETDLAFIAVIRSVLLQTICRIQWLRGAEQNVGGCYWLALELDAPDC
jgi:hypothetical protein